MSGMIKLIYSDAFDTTVDVGMRMIEDPQQLTKSAATIFGCEYDDIKPDKDHVGIHLTALGDYEHYGCFFEGAPVSTLNGIVPIEQIKIGDMALTHMGRYRPVITLFNAAYAGDRIALKLVGMPDPIVCTANHPIRVVRRAGLSPASRFSLREAGTLKEELERRANEAEWAAAETIKPGDYLVMRSELDVTGVDKIEDQFDPYVLGFYVAEGCLVKEYRAIATQGEYKSVLFTGSVNDEATWDYIDSWLVSINRDTIARGESYTSDFGVRYLLGFKELAEKCDMWFGHMATSKHLHPAVWTWDKTKRLKFLAGYFDGDGCLQKNDSNRYYGTLTASTASRSLAFDIQRLLASVGIPASIVKCWNKKANGCFGNGDFPIYSISVGSYYSNKILAHTLRLKPHNREFVQAGASSMQLAENYALIRVNSVNADQVSDIQKYNIEVEEDHSYSVVSCSVANSNRNADGFPKKACIAFHETFVKNGNVYRHHRNKDPEKRLGQIVKSAYNDPMGRIELFTHVHKDKASDELQKLATEGDTSFSMACKVAYDRCTICGTLRKSSKDPEQCEHVLANLGKLAEDGKRVGTLNDEPQFFDISFVTRPADRIAWYLKSASDEVIDSVKLAEAADIWVPDHLAIASADAKDKLVYVQKLAEMERYYAEILSGKQPVTTHDSYMWELRKAASVQQDDKVIAELRKFKPEAVLRKLAAAGILMDVTTFFKYAMGLDYGEVAEYMPDVRKRVRGIYGRLIKSGNCQGVCNDQLFDVNTTGKAEEIPILTTKEAEANTMLGAAMEQRIVDSVILNRNINLDTNDKIGCNDTRIVDVLAEKYAAYKLSALKAIQVLHKKADTDALIAIATAQNLVQ